ncbi:hypothetical protein [Flavobacterium sp.]|uniref:hypothetical protein n=1 Tax=Flavobacterium sp. TaxID=239 RepID=UPI0028BD898A|nr:hypothetical protein [Flavobacterium sp.]
MQDKTTLKNLLGLTQEEMALVLDITASQWSMFKSNKRGLPTKALQQLAPLLHAVQKDVNTNEIEQLLQVEQAKTKEKLKRELQNVHLKLLRTEKKIAILENHRLESFAALKAVTFLANQKEYAVSEDLLQSIQARAKATLNRHNSFKLEQLQLQKKTFEMQKLEMEQQLKEK